MKPAHLPFGDSTFFGPAYATLLQNLKIRMAFGVRAFEDTRWRGHGSALEYRHREALALINKGSVLDMGCGDGILLSELKKQGCAVAGLDISPEAVKKCVAQGIPVKVFDFTNEALPFPENSFDYVVMLDVLEHVLNPTKLLAEAARVSKHYLIISVPNFNSLPARLQALCGRVPENNTPQKGHVYWFNYWVLRRMLNDRGLGVSKMHMNTVFESLPIVGTVARILCAAFPNVFALSFVVKVEKK